MIGLRDIRLLALGLGLLAGCATVQSEAPKSVSVVVPTLSLSEVRGEHESIKKGLIAMTLTAKDPVVVKGEKTVDGPQFAPSFAGQLMGVLSSDNKSPFIGSGVRKFWVCPNGGA